MRDLVEVYSKQQDGPRDLVAAFQPRDLLETFAVNKSQAPDKTLLEKGVDYAKDVASVPYGVAEAATSLVGGMATWPLSKIRGLIHMGSGGTAEEARELEKPFEELVYEPRSKTGKALNDLIGKAFEYGLAPAKKVGEMVTEQFGERQGYLIELGAELATFKAAHVGIKGAKAKLNKIKEQRFKQVDAKPEEIKAVEKLADKVEPEIPREIIESKIIRSEFEREFKQAEKPVIEKPVEISTEKLAIDEVGLPKADVVESTTLHGGLPIPALGKAYTKYIGEPIWDKMIMKGVPKVLEKIPGGKAINRALLYDYRGDLKNTDKFISNTETRQKAQAIGREYAIDLGNRLGKEPQQSQLRIAEEIKGGKVKDLTPKEVELAGEAKRSLYDLGKQASDLGLMSEKIFFKNAGRYMPRLYTSKEFQSNLNRFGLSRPDRLDLSRFKKRKDIPQEIRKEMGEILTPAYPVAKGLAQLTHDVATARWFKGIAENPDWAIPTKTSRVVPADWKKLSSDKKLGPLKDAYVHPEIFQDLSRSIRTMGKGEKFWRKALGSWKFGKVILSPKTHVRNLFSNSVLSHLGGMPMYEQPVYLTRAAKQMRRKGKLWQEAKQEGLMADTFTNAELRSLFDQVDSQLKDIVADSIPERLGKIGTAWEKTKGVGNKAAKLYEAEEQWFKMAKFLYNKKRKKMSSKEAAKDAEKWLFNYSKLTKFQEDFRSKWYGAPFATFTFKALPRISEAAVKTPWRFALPFAMIYGMEQAAQNMIGDSDKARKAKKKMLPEWMKGSMAGIPNFARVPLVDESGREHYLNLSYILPWGDIAESGGAFGIPAGLMPGTMPFVKEPFQQIMNYDSFWKEPIVKESDVAGKEGLDLKATETKKRVLHAAQTFAPTPALDLAKLVGAIRGKPDYRGRFRAAKAVWADVLAGFKMYPVDYADQMMQIIRKEHPSQGVNARKIRSKIKTLSVKKAALKKKGKSTKNIDKQLKEKVAQIFGLATKTRKAAGYYKKTKE